MDYNNIMKQNDIKRNIVSNIKNTNESIDKSETIIKDKLDSKKKELKQLQTDYANIIDIFNHIVKTLDK